MADNVAVTPGSGATLAADDIGGVLYGRTKIVLGNDGVNGGDVSSTNPMPVTGALTDAQLRATAVPVSGPLTDAELRATAVPVSDGGGSLTVDGTVAVTGTFWQATQPVSAASLPLPTGAATETTLASIDAKTPALVTTVPFNNSSAPPTRIVGQDVWNCSFASVGSSILSSDFISPIVGTGVGYSQASGSLLITTGTSTNAEFLTRSVQSWRGSLRMRFSLAASQRIANQNLQITLADLIGSALSYNIVSTTLVDVTLTSHGYTSQNVGQFMNLGGITGAAGVPGRYAIQSIPDANTIRFTVAGWPASGTGTLTLFGWNHVKNLINGTVATNALFDTQRRGWASGDVTITINTTAGTGTIVQNDLNGRDCFVMDQVRTSSNTPNFTARGSRYENMPDDDVVLYVFIWSYNGTSAPASTTTWTIGFVSFEKFANLPVYVQGFRANGAANSIAVTTTGTTAVSMATNTPTLAAGTNLAADVGVQYRANATGAGTIAKALSAASTNATVVKASAGRLLGYHLSNTNAAFRYVKLYNVATAPTAGAGTIVGVIALPPNGTVAVSHPGGIGFATGIAYTMVTGAADADATAVGANDIVGHFVFA